MASDNMRSPPRSLIEAFSGIAQFVHSSEDYEENLRRITETAVHALSACDAASLSLLEKPGPVTYAATAQIALDGDQIQYDENEGPCLDAAMEQRWVYTPDVAVDARWPRSSARLGSELGVGSMLSCRLTLEAAPSHTLGGINLYSTSRAAYTDEDQMMALLLAALGAVVIDASRQQLNLRAAIESRQVIGEAIGTLRSQDPGLSREAAFGILSSASQRMNVKLRDLAQRIADGSPMVTRKPTPPAGPATRR